MNNKGFAISSIIYGILIIFLLLVFSVLGLLVTRKSSLDQIKDNAYSIILGEDIISNLPTLPNYVAPWNKLYLTTSVSTLGFSIDYMYNIYSPYCYTVTANTESVNLTTVGNNSSVTYTVKNDSNAVVDTFTREVSVVDPQIVNFDFTGNVQKLTLDAGIYYLEVWGAQGGYSSGYLLLNQKTNTYIYVGGQGNYNNSSVTDGFNGGATDIRLNTDNLYSRLIVAGGGGDSGFVYTSSTVPEGWLLNSSYYLTNTSLIGGNSTITEPSGESSVGHSGNGYARISKILYYE